MFRLEYRDVIFDSRVLREAKALTNAYEKVTVIDVLGDKSFEEQEIEGIQIERIKLWSKSLPSNYFGRFIKYFEFLIKLVIRGIQKNAQIYHSHDLPTLLPAIITGKLRGAKIIYDSHELYPEMGHLPEKLIPFVSSIENIFIKFVDEIIVANQSRADYMKKKYINIRKPSIVMNLPPINPKVSFKKEPDLLKNFLSELGIYNKIIILYSGVFMKGRCLEELILSTKYIDNNLVLILMGQGENKDQLQQLIIDQNLKDKVFFYRYVPYQNLLKYIASADLGVVIYENTCLNNYYCAPNKLFEYTSMGLPVVASNFPELKRLVGEFDVGKLFNPNDPTSIAKAINNVFSEPQAYQAMKKNTVILNKMYNWQKEKKKLMNIYNRLYLN